MTAWLITILQIIFFLTLAPLLAGWIKWIKCHMQNRTAPSLFQPYKDLNKLFRKQTLKVSGASWIFSATPYIIFCIILVASTLVPSFIINSNSSGYIGDAIVFVGLLALSRFFLALAGLDIGTAFGGMGSSREMMISALTEPSLLLVFLIMAIKTGSTNLPTIVSYMNYASWGILIYPSFIFVFLSALMVTIVEAGRIPIDNPATHLELTMVHEAMILEYSGKELGIIEWTAQIKTMLFFVLLSNLFFPWGIAITNSLTLSSVAFSMLIICGKLMLCAILIVLIETVFAKMRLFKVPYFLGISFALCLLGILSHILFES